MLTEICAEIRNYFSKDADKIFGKFAVVGGAITPPIAIAENQYYRIVGSVFNDGVHKEGDALFDEAEFDGAVWLMRVPQDLIALADDISKWQEKNGAVDSAAMSPFTSESFGGYSYSKQVASDGAAGGTTWQSVFASRLNKYRRIRTV